MGPRGRQYMGNWAFCLQFVSWAVLFAVLLGLARALIQEKILGLHLLCSKTAHLIMGYNPTQTYRALRLRNDRSKYYWACLSTAL
jgi:hypothetical protein